MNKILKTILIISIAIFGAGFLLAPSVFAQDNNLVVEFEQTPHLFTEANFLPGQSVTRWVKVTNNSGQPQRIATEAINYFGFPDKNAIPDSDLSRALLIIIREKGGSDLYGGTNPTGEKTLFNFYQDGETYLNSDISTGDNKTYEFIISFPETAGNDWNPENADKRPTTFFDILVGFQGVEGKVSPGGGGGLPPGLTINYEKPFYIGINTAKITWFTSYYSTSRVIYGTNPGVFDLNNLPNYGYAFSTAEKDTPANPNGVTYHEVWLNDLQHGTTYYFRAISHASPPTISFERSFTTLSAPEDYGGEPISEPAESAAKTETPVTVLGIELKPPAKSGIKKIAKVAIDGAVKVLGIESEQEEAGAPEQTKENEAKQKEVGAADLTNQEQEQEQAKMSLGTKMGLTILLFSIIIILWLIIKKRKKAKKE